jgi:hypothetical protein
MKVKRNDPESKRKRNIQRGAGEEENGTREQRGMNE